MSELIQEKGFEFCDVREPIKLIVSGTIPSWVHGVLYRIGPAKFHISDVQGRQNGIDIDHWFDGLSSVHRFEINEKGEVWYRNRETSIEIEKWIQTKGTLPTLFGQRDPCKSIFLKFMSIYEGTVDLIKGTNSKPVAINVTVTPNMKFGRDLDENQRENEHIKTLTAKTDFFTIQHLDPVTLEPIQDHFKSYENYCELNSDIRGLLSAAHHQYDYKTGDYYNFTLEAGLGFKYNVFVINDKYLKGKVLCSIDHPVMSYAHSFSMTEKYLILIIQPYYARMAGLSILWNGNITDSFEWDENHPTLFHVIDRSNGKLIVTYRSLEPLFFFHTCNSWDSNNGDEITLDVCGYSNPAIIDSLFISKMKSTVNTLGDNDLPQIRRYSLNGIQSHFALNPDVNPVATYTACSEYGLELPRFNPLYTGLPYQYIYSIINCNTFIKTNNPTRSILNSIAKTDLNTGDYVVWSEKNCFPSEPIFLPNPNIKEGEKRFEDDGVVLSVVLDARAAEEGKAENVISFLLILDGKTFTEIARADLPPGVWAPFGFHGSFAGSEKRELDAFN
ncbi:carotenoid oxygenase [Paraphysoderma sedebokerense]|nr:carotenoid oxygenase [Paraphysoderma sedebokerense]